MIIQHIVLTVTDAVETGKFYTKDVTNHISKNNM
jgi:hypothetical protein